MSADLFGNALQCSGRVVRCAAAFMSNAAITNGATITLLFIFLNKVSHSFGEDLPVHTTGFIKDITKHIGRFGFA